MQTFDPEAEKLSREVAKEDPIETVMRQGLKDYRKLLEEARVNSQAAEDEPVTTGEGFDCRPFLDKCKGECCGPAPVPKATWEKYKDLIWDPLAYEREDKHGFVHALTKFGRCPFQSADHLCMIYPQEGEPDERAPVCAKFGNCEDVTLICRWQDHDGRPRRRGERKELSKLIAEEVDYRLKFLEQRGLLEKVPVSEKRTPPRRVRRRSRK